MRRLRSKTAWFLLLALSVRPGAAEPEQLTERQLYKLDQAALRTEDRAIASLMSLLQRHLDTEREPLLLQKLAETHQQAAKIEYRLAHNRAAAANRDPDLAAYRKRLESVVQTASAFIGKYSGDAGTEAMHLARAEAYRELGRADLAKLDHELVATRYSQSGWAIRSNIALGGLAAEKGDYRGAISYLKRVEAFPKSEHFPFVLHQVAWAHFNVDEVPEAIHYLKRRNDYYNEKAAESPDGSLSAPDRALKEQGLRDIVAFYFSRFDKKDPNFPLDRALSFFRDAEPGNYLGQMLLHMAKLLRSRDQGRSLHHWAAQVLEKEGVREESLDVAVTNLEHQCEKGQPEGIEEAARLFLGLRGESPERARLLPFYAKTATTVLQGAQTVQKRLSGEKNTERATRVRKALGAVYRAFLVLADDNHPKLATGRYNLAELLFGQGEFEAAAAEYRRLVDRGGESLPVPRPLLGLKALVSEYRALSAKGLFPKDVSPAELEGERKPDLAALPKALGTWVGRLREHLDDFGREPSGIVEFEYEAYRALYGNRQTRAALEGMIELAKERPRSAVALPAATLALDTFIKNNDWDSAAETAEDFLKIPSLGNGAFRKRLAELPAESAIRRLDLARRSGDFRNTAALSRDFMRRHGNSKWAPHALLLASQAAIQSDQLPRARSLLDELLSRFPRAENRRAALLLRAELSESDLDFDGAARDLGQALETGPAESDPAERAALARKLFFAGWLARQPKAPNCDPFRQTEDLHRECERYRALTALESASPGAAKEAVRLALAGPEENRPLWAAVALEGDRGKLGLKDRLRLAKTLATRWKELDPLLQVTLIGVLNRTLPETFAESQRSLPKTAPLKAETKFLVRRIGIIRDMEAAAEEIVGLPWTQVKVSLLGAVAEVYRDFCGELEKLPHPKDLTPEELSDYKSSVAEILVPFREKGKTIRSRVKSLAAQSAVDPLLVPGLGTPPARRLASAPGVEGALLRALSDEAKKGDGNRDPRREKLGALWGESVKEGEWARAAFFFRELKDNFKLPEASLTAMRAIALSRAGARAEAIAELESARDKLGERTGRLAGAVLQAWYAGSTLPGKAEALALDTRRGREP